MTSPLVLSRVSKRVCPGCGKPKGFYAKACRSCTEWAKPLAGRTGNQHPAWKGGQEIDRDGYVRTYAPGHPWPRRNGYVLEHVRLMELHIGRRLKPNETVHHKDHDKRHNMIGNLEIKTRGEHSRHHRLLDTHLRRRTADGRFA